MTFQKLIIVALALCCATVQAVDVDKESWIEYMKTGLPTYQCQTGKYFRQCFDVAAEKCEEVMASATRTCLAQERTNIPDILNQPKDGTSWGSKIGACAGRAYELTLSKQRISNPKCNNIQSWK